MAKENVDVLNYYRLYEHLEKLHNNPKFTENAALLTIYSNSGPECVELWGEIFKRMNSIISGIFGPNLYKDEIQISALNGTLAYSNIMAFDQVRLAANVNTNPGVFSAINYYSGNIPCAKYSNNPKELFNLITAGYEPFSTIFAKKGTNNNLEMWFNESLSRTYPTEYLWHPNAIGQSRHSIFQRQLQLPFAHLPFVVVVASNRILYTAIVPLSAY